MPVMEKNKAYIIIFGLLAVFALVIFGALSLLANIAERTLSPVTNTTDALATQVSLVLNPTPTVLPDPVVVIHNIRSIARLETVQYTVERVITAEVGQGPLAALFGDRILFIAHGQVLAGVDLEKLTTSDLWVEDGILNVRLPKAEIFIASLDNQKSYVYNRDTGLLTKGNVDLETAARRQAELAIESAALDDGILEQAQRNAENYFAVLLRDLGFPAVTFVDPEP